MTISCRDALAYRQVMTISCKHAVRYSDNKLLRRIGLQAGNDNKLQTFSEIQWQDVAEMH